MKAILVIDMPTECIECPFCRVFADDKLTETHCTWMATTNEDGINTRAEWCPLRPLPQARDEHCRYDNWEMESIINAEHRGFNKCLHEITGETE